MKKILTVIIVPFLLLAFIFGSSGYAKFYKYKDENGVWRYTDTPVTDEQVGAIIEESTDSAKISSRNLASELHGKMVPKNDIEKATMATIGIQTPAGFGSGFFVTDDGFIIT